MANSVPASYAATRAGLHAVAEHVLAAVVHRWTGHIGLRATPGGFGTPPFALDGTQGQVRVEGVELVVAEGPIERRAPLETIGQAAAFVGIEPGAPASVYPPATPLDPDRPLTIDPQAAAVIHDWFRLTGAALDRLRGRHRGLQPSAAQLWPEHFDLAITMGEVNYGGSAGDAEHASPYAYVGPWALGGTAGHDFWNEPFGASRTHRELASVDDVVAFFETGYDLTSRL